MSTFQVVIRRVARSLLQQAAMASPKARTEWAQAMINELDYLPHDMSAVGWALGCLLVCYAERIRAMIRSLESLPRSFLAVEMLVCFAPLTLLFSTVVVTGFHGGFTLTDGLLYCSGAILGPLGLAAAVRLIFVKPAAMSRALTAGLCLLAAWTIVAYSAQILTFGQSHLSDWWREFVIIAVWPALAVLHLVFINSHRRGLLIAV